MSKLCFNKKKKRFKHPLKHNEYTQTHWFLEQHEAEKTESLLKNLTAQWETKCNETESLRILLQQTTNLNMHINKEYHSLKESIAKMREQFGSAIDLNVAEFEELAIHNKSLSERIQLLEEKIERGEKVFK